ncbi:hypothetical protein BRAS3843_2790035 [Bradyrhizobium sp. STM 3843]|nr:hypothetical protein BRAS3843_2790035 [Bradyrhizobium sp. STM 3843]
MRRSRCAPSPRSYGQRVGVRGRRMIGASRWTCTPSPGLHLAMQSDLSPQAGRGEGARLERQKNVFMP